MKSVFAALGVGLLACVAGIDASRADADCWIEREHPQTASQLPVTSPQVAGMRAAAHAINESLKANKALRALPDVRWRSSWQLSGHPDTTDDPYGLHLVLWAHGPQSWVGECDLIPQADRLRPVAAVVVQTNSVHSTLTQLASMVRDETLHAVAEPEPVGRVGKYTLYRGQWIVLTYDGRMPWVPVTMEEYLAFEERRLVAAEAEADRNIASAQAGAGAFDEEALREAYEEMKKVDPAQAESFLAMMEQVKQDTARAAAAAPPITNAYTKELADLRALRASLSPQALTAQARDGYNSLTPRVPVERMNRLVKLDPSWPKDRENPNRILMMEVHFSGQGAPYDSLMREAAETFDWPLFESLMR